MKDLEDEARTEMDRIIKSHDYELDEVKKAEVRKIYAEGERYFK